MNEKLKCRYYAGNGKPVVKPVKIVDKDGNTVQAFKSANEYKQWRKGQKSLKAKIRKESK